MHTIGLSQHARRQARTPAGLDLAVIALTLLVPALGGATRLWEQAIVLLGCGCLVLFSPTPPSSDSRGKTVFLPLLGLALLAGAEFLPAPWFPQAGWRQTLQVTYQLTLPGTLTPQPWLSLENSLLLLFGMSWATWLGTRAWTLRRPQLLAVYGAGLLALVTVSLVLASTGSHFALWQPQSGGFGFFPNRNQSANLVAIGSICLLALALHHIRRRQKVGYFWATGYVLALVAIVVNYSRAGVIIFFLGSLAWLLWTTLASSRRRGTGLGLSAVLLLLTGFLLFGGQTRARFVGTPDHPADSIFGRFVMQADALRLINEVAWHGIGLGNFPPVFAHYRLASAQSNRAIHPESDWLWLGAELGWLAPGLVLLTVGMWLWQFWPKRGEQHFNLNAALAVATLAFVAHGFMDVSGHRMGTAWPILFLASLMRTDPKSNDRKTEAGGQRTKEARLTSRISLFALCSLPLALRVSGLLMVVVSTLWLSSALGVKPFPNSASLDRIRTDLAHAQQTHRYDDTIYLAGEGLRFAPLDWELYFYRAMAHAALSTNELDQAILDFGRAQFLEPNMVQVPFEQGRICLRRDPRLSVVSWGDALHRAGTNGAGWYRQMLQESTAVPEIRNDLRAFALDEPDLLLVFLAQATPTEVAVEIQRLLMEDPELRKFNPAQRQAFLSSWARNGHRQLLADKFREHPEWLELSWAAYAEVMAADLKFQEADELVLKRAPKPPLPKSNLPRPIAELKRDLLISTNDFVTGYALYEAHLAERAESDALVVLRKLTLQADCPRYFWYLQAGLEMRGAEWEKAWQSWSKYLR